MPQQKPSTPSMLHVTEIPIAEVAEDAARTLHSGSVAREETGEAYFQKSSEAALEKKVESMPNVAQEAAHEERAERTPDATQEAASAKSSEAAPSNPIKEVYFPWQAGQEKKVEEPLDPEQIALKEAQRFGRLVALICFGLFAGVVVISIFVSIYRAVHAPPQVWIPLENTERKGYVMPPHRLRTCVARLRRLDQEMEQESKNLWFRVRRGNRYYLTAWQDWSRDWQHRMDVLLKQCPLRGDDEISRSFRRASTQMLELHKRQHKVFSEFFSKAAWLFREVREGMHVLQEELRQ
ncbi:hypothetical protein L6R29_16900 [Myxococcota bacterium]|nr:hypothetical protein [Myxococcota bacterium]